MIDILVCDLCQSSVDLWSIATGFEFRVVMTSAYQPRKMPSILILEKMAERTDIISDEIDDSISHFLLKVSHY